MAVQANQTQLHFVTNVLSGMRLREPDRSGGLEVFQVMLRCWQATPEARPTAATVLQALQDLVRSKFQISCTNYGFCPLISNLLFSLRSV